jgi:hypothetical protein
MELTMRWPTWGLAGLVALALGSFWLLLAGPDEMLGLDLGGFGIGLAALVSWSAIHGISAAPRGELDRVVSPGEWKAWIGFGFTLLVAAYLFSRRDVIAGAGDLHDLGRIGRNIVLLVIAWSVVSRVLAWRWQGDVLADERDQVIDTRAAAWGRGATTVGVIGVAVTLGLTPAARLAWATPIVVAHLLVFVLVCGCLVESAVAGASYWRERAT